MSDTVWHHTDGNPGRGWGSQGDKGERLEQYTGKSGTRTFCEIGSEILVQLVKVGFGDDNGVQRRVISALVRRAPRLERAVLIARYSRVSGRSWGGRCAGGARRPLHGVHSALSSREEAGDGSVGVVGGGADEMRRPFSVNTLTRASRSQCGGCDDPLQVPINLLLKTEPFLTQDLTRSTRRGPGSMLFDTD